MADIKEQLGYDPYANQLSDKQQQYIAGVPRMSGPVNPDNFQRFAEQRYGARPVNSSGSVVGAGLNNLANTMFGGDQIGPTWDQLGSTWANVVAPNPAMVAPNQNMQSVRTVNDIRNSGIPLGTDRSDRVIGGIRSGTPANQAISKELVATVPQPTTQITSNKTGIAGINTQQASGIAQNQNQIVDRFKSPSWDDFFREIANRQGSRSDSYTSAMARARTAGVDAKNQQDKSYKQQLEMLKQQGVNQAEVARNMPNQNGAEQKHMYKMQEILAGKQFDHLSSVQKQQLSNAAASMMIKILNNKKIAEQFAGPNDKEAKDGNRLYMKMLGVAQKYASQGVDPNSVPQNQLEKDFLQ